MKSIALEQVLDHPGARTVCTDAKEQSVAITEQAVVPVGSGLALKHSIAESLPIAHHPGSKSGGDFTRQAIPSIFS